MTGSELQKEGQAFDLRIEERVKNGLIPDLDNAASVDWFYNNPWRRKLYVDMIFGDYFRFAKRHIPKTPSLILEIGSGLGHMCLQLAREGHEVTGLELSSKSVEVARNYYNGLDAPSKGKGKVEYINADFMSWTPEKEYDVVCFFLTLHHFEDPDSVLKCVKKFLSRNGRIVVVEPARDLFSKRNAFMAYAIRELLALNGRWYSKPANAMSLTDLDKGVEDVLFEYQEARERNENEQSPHDNSSYASVMINALSNNFTQIDLDYGNTLTPRLLGGIRAESEAEIEKVAQFIKQLDNYGTKMGLLEPGVFYFAGELKK